MRKKLIISNWKDNISTPAQAEGLLESINGYLDARGEGVEFSLVFCPTLKLVEDISGLLKEGHLEHEAELGVQDIELGDDVKFSGAVLNKLGVRYVIVGHSDRRWKMGESDETVNRKLKTVLANEMIPIVCIGERERDPSTDSGQASGWTFTHNPFSRAVPEHEEALMKKEDVGKILTTQYDIVMNGYEIGGGSIRAYTPELLKATFKTMGFAEERMQKFVFGIPAAVCFRNLRGACFSGDAPVFKLFRTA